MGWCSATDIFDAIGKLVLPSKLTDDEKSTIMGVLANALEEQDWDCQSDSRYFDNPIVVKLMKKLHPDWDWSE